MENTSASTWGPHWQLQPSPSRSSLPSRQVRRSPSGRVPLRPQIFLGGSGSPACLSSASWLKAAVVQVWEKSWHFGCELREAGVLVPTLTLSRSRILGWSRPPGVCGGEQVSISPAVYMRDGEGSDLKRSLPARHPFSQQTPRGSGRVRERWVWVCTADSQESEWEQQTPPSTRKIKSHLFPPPTPTHPLCGHIKYALHSGLWAFDGAGSSAQTSTPRTPVNLAVHT